MRRLWFYIYWNVRGHVDVAIHFLRGSPGGRLVVFYPPWRYPWEKPDWKYKVQISTFLNKVQRENKDPRNTCFECLGYGHRYMVTEDVWNSAWPEYKELEVSAAKELRRTWNPDGSMRLLLCFKCLSKKLGRDFVHGDFTDVPINRHVMERSVSTGQRG
jgi:hypothetical protein